MEIQILFAYEIGEILWYASNDRHAKATTIQSYRVRKNGNEIEIKYVSSNIDFYLKDRKLYKTKEECNLAIINEISEETA